MVEKAESAEGAPGDPLLAAVGARIRELREARELAPVDFARAAGFSLQYLWRLEGGQQNLNLRSVSRIALALGVPMTALLEGIEPSPATLAKRRYVRKPGSVGSGDESGDAPGAGREGRPTAPRRRGKPGAFETEDT